MLLSLPDLITKVRRLDSSQEKYEHTGKIYFLRNYTVEMIEPFLKYHLYEAKINPLIQFGDYDVIHQEVLDPCSKLHKMQPDIIVIALVLENIIPDMFALNEKIDEVKEHLNQIYKLVSKHSNALIAINTFIPPFYSEWGIAHSPDILGLNYLITELNQYIRRFVIEHGNRFFIVDWERLIRILGEDNGIDYRYWYSSKAPFKNAFLDLYAIEIMKITRALKGKAKKCVLLDCDNTLWGGIIGEDGIEGIKLDKDIYPGRAFYEFQRNLIYLFERGVILCLCSKNNEDDVWEVLDNHPQSLLKRKHFSAWRINWDDKVSNIQSLADELNIGIDSMVFVDDSPMECELVEERFPQVTVLQVPDKLYHYPHLLFKAGLFDTLKISEEDKNRTAMYQAQARRNSERNKFTDIADYLSSLELQATIHPVRKEEIPRTAQLTQKTNQFNLTTRRYSEADIAAMSKDPLKEVYTLSVKDRHGDYGLTGVLIASLKDKKCMVDSLLLSCRILGRRLEYVFVQQCFQDIQKNHPVEIWEAEYIPTVKNQQVIDFWDKVGFTAVNQGGGKKFYKKIEDIPQKIKADFIEIIEE
jgi:FkbH-like protein